MHRPAGILGPSAVVFLSALVAAGCSVVGVAPDGHPQPLEEHMPRWASMDLRGDPGVATRDLRLTLAFAEDGIAFRSIEIPSGTVIRWSEGVSEGTFRLRSREPDCQLDVALPPERNTPLLYRHGNGTCRFEMTDPVVSGEAGALAATVLIQPWSELLVETVSLDEPRQPVPDPVPPDEGGLAQLSPLWPGRYEVRLRRGDEILERREIEIDPTGPQDSYVELTLDGVPD